MDISQLTLGEIDTLEELSGLPAQALADEDKPKAKQMAALAYIIKKRSDPDYTLEMARKLTQEEFKDILTGDTPELKK